MGGEPAGGEEHGLDQEQVELDLVSHWEPAEARCDWMRGSAPHSLDLPGSSCAEPEARKLQAALHIKVSVGTNCEGAPTIGSPIFERSTHDHRSEFVVERIAGNDRQLKVRSMTHERNQRCVDACA